MPERENLRPEVEWRPSNNRRAASKATSSAGMLPRPASVEARNGNDHNSY